MDINSFSDLQTAKVHLLSNCSELGLHKDKWWDAPALDTQNSNVLRETDGTHSPVTKTSILFSVIRIEMLPPARWPMIQAAEAEILRKSLHIASDEGLGEWRSDA